MTTANKIIEKQDDLIELLVEDLRSCAFIAVSHGWKSSRKVRGMEIWAEINELKGRL